MNELKFLIKKSELCQDQAKGVSLDGGSDQLFLVRSEDQIAVWLNNCPHNHRPLEYQKDKFLSADGQHIVCYAHSAHFDKLSGECFAGPCKGKKLIKIQHIEINDEIYVETKELIGIND